MTAIIHANFSLPVVLLELAINNKGINQMAPIIAINVNKLRVESSISFCF